MNKLTYRLISAIVLLALTFGSYSNIGASSALAAATTYYVSTSGNDASAGTSSAPFKTIQKCLNVVIAGGSCQIKAGTYNEALALKVTGTQSAPITLKCETAKACTVSSGSARSLVVPAGQKGFYVIDGFRFISTAPIGDDPMTATVNFAYNYWGDGDKFEKGNDGFIFRNNYVEGALYLYGSDNLIEGNEFNGRKNAKNGITERSQPSENNIFRNNKIHDYVKRGGWSMQMTQNTMWEGNTFYNIGSNGSGSGIDCDGAGTAVYGCNVKNNLFYNVQGEGAIIMENGFNSIVEGNTIRDSLRGVSVINYNIENGDGFKADKNYKGLMTNTIIRNNVIYNVSYDGLLCKAVRGNQFLNNTIYNAKVSLGYFGGVALSSYTKVYCPDWIIKNNIVSQSPKAVSLEGNPPLNMNTNFYDVFNANIYNSGNKTFVQWQAMGKDVNGKIGNPMFVNAATGDFRLQANSPACGMGVFPCGGVASTVTSIASPAPTLSSPTQVLPTTAPVTATPQSPVPTLVPATPITVPTSIKSVDVRVAKGENDAEESSSGQVNINSATLELVYESSTQKVGVRFMGVGIPQGATIINAYVQFKAGNISSYATNLSIQGDASANAQAFASTSKNISSRSRTAGIVKWSPFSWLKIGEVGSAQLTPNLAPIIQEIVNKPDWVSGNSMAMIITGSGLRTARTYEGDAAGAPLLHIEYTTGTMASKISAPLAMVTAAVPTELPTTLPTAQEPVVTATALPLTEVPVSTATPTVEAPSSIIPITSSLNGGQDSVLPISTPTADSINTINQQPVITSNGSISIAENTTVVTTVTAADADLPAQTLAYSISGGADAALLNVNSSTGELTFVTAPDFENPVDSGVDNIYNVTIQASDGTLTATQDVIVTVTAIDDNIPAITSNGSLSIAENTAAVTTVTATDVDLPAETLTYSISGGADAALFNINSSTGELTFIAAPDFELPADAGMDNIYNVTVQVFDGTLAATQEIVLTVTEINDNTPVITSGSEFSIAENTAAVTTVAATDADLPIQALTYSISGGADSSLFNINSSTGELTFIAAPDFELPVDVGIDNIYNVTVQASDGTLATIQDVVVTVTEINDNTPVITSNGNLSIAENTVAVTTVTATDADLPLQVLTYSISGGADSAFFNINSSTGELSFITSPDFEIPTDAGNDNVYNITIQTSDGMLITTQDIAIAVTAVDDNTPVITSNGDLSIAENTVAVTTVIAADADLSAQPLTYSISGGADAALFNINSSTGELAFIVAPNYGIPMDAGVDNIYNVTVKVSGGNLTATQDIVVTIKGADQPQ